MEHGHHLRMHTVYAMFLARLQELSHRTARSFPGLLEEKLGRNALSGSGPRAAAAALRKPVHGVATLARAGASYTRGLQMMMISFFFSLFVNDTLRYPEILTIMIIPDTTAEQKAVLGKMKCFSSIWDDSTFVQTKSVTVRT